MEQIQQVLYNLLDNAVKFSNDNSSIILETTVNHGKVFVSVKDHGTGIPKESLSKIMGPPFTKSMPPAEKTAKEPALDLQL